MKIFAAGTRPSMRANPDYFTGMVWQDPIILTEAPARLHALKVHFEPGARTAWHTHPFGQTLHVTHGAGLVCLRGEAPRIIRAGDTAWIPADAETLAWSRTRDDNDPYRDAGNAGWISRHLAGASE